MAIVTEPAEVHVKIVAEALSIASRQVGATARLLDEGATVPFIARYRKEATGSLDEVAVAAIRDQLAALVVLDKRRAAIIGSLTERGLLSAELARQIAAARTAADLEDRYLPFRPKRKTRASTARDRGLEPLADALLAGERKRIALSMRIDAATRVG